MSHRGPRPHHGHRSHRRRGTDPARRHDAPVTVARLEPRSTCLADWECSWHGACSACGDLIHLGQVEASLGFGPVDVEALARLIVGTPPRCADCRHRHGRP